LIGAGLVVRSASRAARDLLGFDPRELEHRPLAELLHPEDRAVLASLEGGRHRRLEIRMRHRNGYWLDVEALANDMSADVNVDALVLTVRDVTERKAFEEQLRHRAFHDPLTQLPNRALLSDRLQHALSREGRFEDQVAVLFVDLDDFKTVNDTLGHASGDELLVLVARRLRSCLRSADTAARLGGDEFGVLLEGVPDVDHAVTVAQRILDAFVEPFSIAGLPVPLRASVGVAMGVAQTISADELLRNADIAMYAAKRAGKRGHVVFRADRHGDLARRFGGLSVRERQPGRAAVGRAPASASRRPVGRRGRDHRARAGRRRRAAARDARAAPGPRRARRGRRRGLRLRRPAPAHDPSPRSHQARPQPDRGRRGR
jgi:diguanylate cyclase (GGDEF)-like protein/PAS domain S-box-containing protein